MKRISTWLGLMTLMVALAPMPVHAQTTTSFSVAAIGANGEALTSGRCRVFTDDTSTDATDLYSDAALATSLTSPIALNTTTGTCTWYSSQSATTAKYDVQIYIDGGTFKGQIGNIDNVTRTGLKTARFEQSNGLRVYVVPFTTSTGSATTTTTYKIPPGATVKDAMIEVTTAVAASTMDVGLDVASGAIAARTFICSAINTTTAKNNFAVCSPTAPTVFNGELHASTSYGISYNTQGHATAGFIWVYFLNGSNPSN